MKISSSTGLKLHFLRRISSDDGLWRPKDVEENILANFRFKLVKKKQIIPALAKKEIVGSFTFSYDESKAQIDWRIHDNRNRYFQLKDYQTNVKVTEQKLVLCVILTFNEIFTI